AQYTDAAGKITILSYDTNNNLISAQGPTGFKTTWQFNDPAHQFLPTQMTDPQGNILTYAYDPSGNLQTVTDQLATQNQVQIAHNANGTVSSTTDANGHVTSYGYDASGNLTSITPPTPLGGQSMTVDGLSRLSSLTDGKAQRTGYTYDPLDCITQIG